MLRPLSVFVALLLAQAGCLLSDSGSSQSESETGSRTDAGEDEDDGDGNRDAGHDDGGDGDDGGHDDDDDGDCEKIEDGDIGVEVAVELGSTTVSFGDWVEKEDSPGEYVGFTITVEGSAVSYRVKAGGEVFEGSETTWIHPNGTSGPEAKGISNVEVCEDDGEDDGGDGEDDGDGEDGGDGGDGHDDGGDGEDDGDDGSDDGGDVNVP